MQEFNCMFPSENIPDPDRLFYRLHQSYFVEGILTPGVFRDRGEGMSYSAHIKGTLYAQINSLFLFHAFVYENKIHSNSFDLF